MRIGIATIYKAYNYGSFYQAFGLQHYLQGLGHEVRLLNIDSIYNRRYRLRRQLRGGTHNAAFSAKMIGSYRNDWQLYSVERRRKPKYDLVVIGSDELWNIRNGSFCPAPEYYGLSLPSERVVTYASCVGPCGIGDFDERRDLLDGIRGIGMLSARDLATERFLHELMPEKKVTRVLDPSFLVDWEPIEKGVKKEDYILVYTYDGDWGFSGELIEDSKRFSKDSGLPLVSVGFRNDWCDESIACGPRRFLGYLRNARYVLTDTFHGTAMSIQYRKQFMCMGGAGRKSGHLVEEFGLESRLHCAGVAIHDEMQTAIDYSSIDGAIGQKREASMEYLRGLLERHE